MKMNKLLKVMFCFLIIFLLVDISDVLADCLYTSDTSIADMETGKAKRKNTRLYIFDKTRFSCFDDARGWFKGSQSSSCSHAANLSTAGVSQDMAEDATIEDEGLFYCIETLYFTDLADHRVRNVYNYTISSVPDGDNNLQVKLVEVDNKDGKTYGHVSANCKTGGKAKFEELKSYFDNFENNWNKLDFANRTVLDAEEKNYKQKKNELVSYINDDYCYMVVLNDNGDLEKLKTEANQIQVLIQDTMAMVVEAASVAEANATTPEEKAEAQQRREEAQQNAEKYTTEFKEITDAIQDIEIVINKRKVKIKFDDEITCGGLIDEDLAEVIRYALNILMIAVPIGLIILITIDFATPVISNDQDAIKKATSKAVKRLIAGVVIFFIPLIVKVILNMDGIVDVTDYNPNCLIDEVLEKEK